LAAQDQNKVCPKCFEVNDPAATFCIECGAPLSDDPGAEGSDQEVYREITQANLSRIRGDYKQAVDICLGILKRFPNNGTAHTLLGDIYAEQGELEQAAQWFEMALDLRPESQNDRRKLEAVQRRQSEQEAASTAQQLGIPESRPRTQQYLYVMVLLVAIVGIGSFLLGRSINKRVPESRPSVISDPIDLTPPAPNDPTPEPADPIVPATTFPGTPSDQEVAALLAGKYTVGRKLVSAHEDPRGPSLRVVARLEPGDDPAMVCVEFARAVFVEYPSCVLVTVEITDGTTTTFIADVARADYQRTADGTVDAKTMLSRVWPVQPN